METWIALFMAVIALVTSVLGILKFWSESKQWKTQLDEDRDRWKTQLDDERDRWKTQLDDERDRWKTQLDDERDKWERERHADLRAGFLHDLVEERLRLYPPVFKLLGNVHDTDPGGAQHADLAENPGQLLDVAEKLFEHIYGDAGLVMTMRTRNVLLAVWQECHRFQDAHVSIGDIDYGFMLARRLLRADIQLEDIEDIETELFQMAEKFAKGKHAQQPLDPTGEG